MTLVLSLPTKARAARRNLETAKELGHLDTSEGDLFVLLQGVIVAMEQHIIEQHELTLMMLADPPPPSFGACHHAEYSTPARSRR